MTIEDTLKNIISEFISDTEHLKVTAEETDNTVSLLITQSDKSDVSKIIGKKGRTISSLRVIMRAIYNAKNSESKTPKKLRITVKESKE